MVAGVSNITVAVWATAAISFIGCLLCNGSVQCAAEWVPRLSCGYHWRQQVVCSACALQVAPQAAAGGQVPQPSHAGDALGQHAAHGGAVLRQPGGPER